MKKKNLRFCIADPIYMLHLFCMLFLTIFFVINVPTNKYSLEKNIVQRVLGRRSESHCSTITENFCSLIFFPACTFFQFALHPDIRPGICTTVLGAIILCMGFLVIFVPRNFVHPTDVSRVCVVGTSFTSNNNSREMKLYLFF